MLFLLLFWKILFTTLTHIRHHHTNYSFRRISEELKAIITLSSCFNCYYIKFQKLYKCKILFTIILFQLNLQYICGNINNSISSNILFKPNNTFMKIEGFHNIVVSNCF